tara:strand:+ start:223 stop:471 length:249 start_codon:yes stop_codon:yes gene_type:complete
MIKIYDETTGGAKRVDWQLTCLDWTDEEDKELITLITRFLAKRPFANDIEDLDIDLEVNVTGKWHDEFPNYSHIKCREYKDD